MTGWLRRRGAACGRNSRAGAGAAVCLLQAGDDPRRKIREPQPGAKLRAKLVGQDAESHAFLAATEAAGLQLGTDHARASHKIICVSTALKEFQQYGPDIYTEGLRAIVDAWQTWPAASSGRNRRAVSGAALRFLQAGDDPRRKNRLSARGAATLTPCALVSSRA